MSMQPSLFPQSCAENGHDYECADNGYYKQDENEVPIKGKVYRMIFCTRCGDNKEIMVVDRTLPENKTKSSRKLSRRRK